MRYRARVIPLREGRKQEDKATFEYTDAASIAQAGRFLRQRYPYPEYVVEEPVEDPREVKVGRGNPIKEGCFILGLALLKISSASELAAWGAKKNSPIEAIDALDATIQFATQAKAIGYITEEQIERMRKNANLVYNAYGPSVFTHDIKKEEIQDALADITALAHEVAFEALVKCQCGEEFISKEV